jgi:hypothetical protein
MADLDVGMELSVREWMSRFAAPTDRWFVGPLPQEVDERGLKIAEASRTASDSAVAASRELIAQGESTMAVYSASLRLSCLALRSNADVHVFGSLCLVTLAGFELEYQDFLSMLACGLDARRRSGGPYAVPASILRLASDRTRLSIERFLERSPMDRDPDEAFGYRPVAAPRGPLYVSRSIGAGTAWIDYPEGIPAEILDGPSLPMPPRN